MLSEEIKKKLLEKFIYVASEGFSFNILLNFNTITPLVAIWEESEEPTDEEIECIHSRILQDEAKIYYPDAIKKQKYTVERHNTVTLKKEDGLWSYRRLSWCEGPTWAPVPGLSIEGAAERLHPQRITEEV